MAPATRYASPMSNDPRLWLGQPLDPNSPVCLSRENSHYLISVMRRETGSCVRLFNGQDGEWRAEIVEAHRKAAVLKLVKQTRPQVPGPDLSLYFAPVKRQKNELIVEKATELGARLIQPVVTDRTQKDRLRMDRFEVIATEAAEQTERLDLPQLLETDRLETILSGWDASRPLYFCDEAGDDPEAPWGGPDGRAGPMYDVVKDVGKTCGAILIGPEGGFSTAERSRLHGLGFVHPVTLGPRILRAETAAVSAMTIWQAACGDW